MRSAERYPFISSDAALGEASFRPYLPLTLSYQQGSVTASALLDTGASNSQKLVQPSLLHS